MARLNARRNMDHGDRLTGSGVGPGEAARLRSSAASASPSARR
jgi:hypothetical protein